MKTDREKMIEDIQEYILKKYPAEKGYTFLMFAGKKNKNDTSSFTVLSSDSVDNLRDVLDIEFSKLALSDDFVYLDLFKESIFLAEDLSQKLLGIVQDNSVLTVKEETTEIDDKLKNFYGDNNDGKITYH